ncbi:retinol-binding protein pinta-like isoform X1 [Rhodnius prolixus]|uniref:retinol-binding protein pinta-like isoform X1 n=1 Tax=Rhodnius prolixus TaxID=13249 RepID=UPI003D18D8B7
MIFAMKELIEPLTSVEEEKILTETRYSREQLKKDLEHLKDWLQKQTHLPPSRLTEGDKFLQMFLTGSKGSLETAKRKLDNYYTYRTHSELLENRDPLIKGYSDVLDIGYVCLTPQTGKQAERLVYVGLTNPDPEKYDIVLQLRRFLDVMDIKLRLEELSTSHFVVLDNRNGVTGHLLRVKPTIIRELLQLVQDVYPFRISGVLIINTPPFIDAILNKMVIPFLKKKLRERIHVTSKGHEIVNKYVDKRLIPKDYGGDNLSIKELTDAWDKKILEKREWFINELSERTDESKRVDLTGREDGYFGVHGSLKKLVID